MLYFFRKNSSLVTSAYNLLIYKALECDELRFQLVTQALLSSAVTSYRINSSHHNILTDSTLNHDVTSDEFLTKTFLLMLSAAMLHGAKEFFHTAKRAFSYSERPPLSM